MGFLKLKAVRENRERRRPVKEEYGLIFDGSPTPVPGHLVCGFVPSFGVIEIGRPIPKQCNLVLKCQIKSMSELDDNSLVIIIFHQVNELLEVVNIVINWILGLVPAGSFC